MVNEKVDPKVLIADIENMCAEVTLRKTKDIKTKWHTSFNKFFINALSSYDILTFRNVVFMYKDHLWKSTMKVVEAEIPKRK